jgi:hypothetical protein
MLATSHEAHFLNRVDTMQPLVSIPILRGGRWSIGTAYTLRYKKGFVPMVGTSVDRIYGYLVECAEFRKKENSS